MEPFIGEIRLFPYNFEPRGWTLCNGRLLSIGANEALYSLIEVRFGGDGRTTFALPTLRGPADNTAYYIATAGIYPSRS